VSLDLEFDAGQEALADAVARLCRDRLDDDAVRAAAGTFPREAWGALAELGVLEIGTPEGEGGALELQEPGDPAPPSLRRRRHSGAVPADGGPPPGRRGRLDP